MKGIDGYDPIPVYFFPVPLLLLCLRDSAGRRWVSPRRLFPAPAGAASAADPGRGVSGPDLRSRDGLPVHVLAMNTENSTDGFAPDRHAHKSESPGFLTPTMLHHVRGLHPAKRFKDLAEIVPCHIAGQVTYTDIHSVPLPSYGTLVFGERAKQRERIRETGLEAGNAARYEQSCFKASSGDHPEFRTTRNQGPLYHPPPHKQCFLFFPSKICLMHPARRKTRNRCRRIDYLANNVDPVEV